MVVFLGLSTWAQQDHRPNIMMSLGNPAEEKVEGLQKPEGSRTIQENPKNHLTWAHRNSQRLNWQPRSLHGTDLESLNICYSCITWSSFVSPFSWNRGCLCLFCWFLGHYSSYWFTLANLPATWSAMLWWHLWKAWKFLNRKRCGIDLGRSKGRVEEGTCSRGGRENFGQNVK